jgi:hypothetical protein
MLTRSPSTRSLFSLYVVVALLFLAVRGRPSKASRVASGAREQ